MHRLPVEANRRPLPPAFAGHGLGDARPGYAGGAVHTPPLQTMNLERTGASRPVAYISGPLQAARDIELARRFYERLAEVCCASGCDVYLPHRQTDPVRHARTTARSVFLRDLNAITVTDLIVAYVGAPSLGVGAEIGIAHQLGIPVIGLCGPEGVASRLIEGLLDSAPEARLIHYRDQDDCCRLLAADLESRVVRHRSRRVAG
jgi:nucleoside 2-deoxyribosyltransferase